jgi:hypothetical protein
MFGWLLVGLFLLLPLGAQGICETLHFTSASKSKTFGRTLWTSDQPVARFKHRPALKVCHVLMACVVVGKLPNYKVKTDDPS